jgi:CubicO group peptidase (beta-lactamase class C family)
MKNGVVVDACDTDRLVPWWSFTKTVLAAAALALVRDGAIQLDRPIPGRLYTLRHLLQHRSGLVEYGWFPAYHDAVARGDQPWNMPDLLAQVDAGRLRYVPGEGWEYSNIGYLFVRQMVEEITQKSIDNALRHLVLHPLGIESARVATRPEDLAGVVMGSASSYHPAWVYHGLMIGRIEDAALLLDRLMNDGFLPGDLLQTMLKPFMLPDLVPGRAWKNPGYGLGVMRGDTTRGQMVAGHTGGGLGSTIAVYALLGQEHALLTSAFFATSEEAYDTEESAFDLLVR